MKESWEIRTEKLKMFLQKRSGGRDRRPRGLVMMMIIKRMARGHLLLKGGFLYTDELLVKIFFFFFFFFFDKNIFYWKEFVVAVGL